VLQLVLMSILIAAGVLVTGVSRAVSRAAADRGHLMWMAEATGAFAVAAVSFLWLARLNPPPGPSNEPFLLVIPCLFFGQCFTGGAGSSVLLDNGAVWPDILIVVRYFGGTARDLYTVVVALLALGVAVVFVMASRFVRPALAAPSAAFALAFLGGLSLASPLLDCSATFLFSTSAAAALFIFALSGRPLALAIAALFASHAVNAHTSAVSILPALVVLSAVAGQPVLRSLGLAGICYVGACAVTSSQALFGSLGALFLARLLPLVVIAVILLVVAGVRLNPLYRRLSVPAKAAVVAGCLILPHLAGVLLLLVIRHPVFPRYLPPVVAPVSIAAAVALAWPAEHLLPTQAARWGRFLLPMTASLCALGFQAWPTV